LNPPNTPPCIPPKQVALEGIAPSIGSVRDAYDDALES
jgi:hypothetical protein